MSPAATIEEVRVLVVGGGPVGMTASILLARQGIRNLLVERKDVPDAAPAAHVVNARTFEILRSAGLDMARVDAACKDPSDAGFVRWVTTLCGEELGCLPFERQGEDTHVFTPTPLRNLSQHRLEPILLEHLQKQDDALVLRGHAWEGAEQDPAGVTSRIRDLATGRVREIRSRHLLAADGAGSRVRKAVGIELEGPPRLRSFVMIHFEANLRDRVGHRPAVLYWTTAPRAIGTFVAHDIDSTWVYMHGFDPEHESADDYDDTVCTEIVRQALGDPSFVVPIRTVRTWHMSVQVAARYRAGRIFLVGDAAHRFPPTGGLGLNTGVQDAHNLVWKIAAVESGLAHDSLLDTYETERRPVARENADVSARNAGRLLEVYQALAAEGDASEKRTRVAAAIANQAEHFDMLGLQLGFRYEAGAVVPDGSAPPEISNHVREYVPSARPGARLPHAWILHDGNRVSTLDRVADDRFTLIVGPEGRPWVEAAASLSTIRLRCLTIGVDIPDPDASWLRCIGIGSAGALLIRPDQHVAFRSATGVDDPLQALRTAFQRLLGN